MGLKEYKKKRDFRKTSEPAAKAAGSGKSQPRAAFVVQKHQATRLHYDFRLEMDGVLKSWAVPKGPSLDPAQKRLAVHVEDHPLDYRDFEGTIPEGEYGGGAVMIWDEGRVDYDLPEKDQAGMTDKAMAKLVEGRKPFSFALAGKKLAGLWRLVPFAGRTGSGEKEKGDNWLLIKSHDEHARTAGDILEAEPDSVRSGRSLEEIAGRQRQ